MGTGSKTSFYTISHAEGGSRAEQEPIHVKVWDLDSCVTLDLETFEGTVTMFMLPWGLAKLARDIEVAARAYEQEHQP